MEVECAAINNDKESYGDVTFMGGPCQLALRRRANNIRQLARCSRVRPAGNRRPTAVACGNQLLMLRWLRSVVIVHI